jgi:hypothetical protein
MTEISLGHILVHVLGSILATQIFASAYQLQHKSVIIEAEGRSGSSFFSTMFNIHPNVTFLYEPLYGQAAKNPAKYEQIAIEQGKELCHHLTQEILGCEIFEPTTTTSKIRRLLWRCSRSRACIAATNGVFAYPGSSVDMTTKMATDEEVRLIARRMKESCLHSQAVVAKSIRMYNIFDNLSVLDEPAAKHVKVIQLFRDPRAVLNSRLKLSWDSSLPFPEAMEWRCNVTRQRAALPLSASFQGVLRIHYEDLIVDLENTVREVYKFIGITIHPRVQKWVEEYQKKFAAKTSKAESDRASDHELCKKGLKKYCFETQGAKGRSTLEAWQNELTSEQLKVIEDKCGDIISQLGYKLTSQSDQTHLPAKSKDSSGKSAPSKK